MKKLSGVITFMVCIPLIATMFVKPDKDAWKNKETDTSVINERFSVCVREDIGTFHYTPENLTELVMYRVIPQDIAFSISEDYIEGTDPEQEYLKALAIVCRSNIVAAWEAEQCPAVLDFDRIQFEAGDFYQIHTSAGDAQRVRLNEIRRAVSATMGAVITKEGSVTTAPFFTTSPAGMLVSEAGEGSGFSLNYAYELAAQGMDFYEILKSFFEGIRVDIYE